MSDFFRYDMLTDCLNKDVKKVNIFKSVANIGHNAINKSCKVIIKEC